MLWRNFQTYMSAHPSLKVAEMHTRIASLENEILTLKGLEPKVARFQDLLKVRDEEIAARDRIIAEEQRQEERFHCEAREVNAWKVEALAQLADEVEIRDNLEAELGSFRARVSMLEMDPSDAKTAQKKAKVKKEEVVSRKQYVTKLQKSAEGRYKRLRRKYNRSKNKAKRLLKQLSFVPWLRDFGWA